MAVEVHIPDIGDIDEVEVIEICVAAGDSVGPEDSLIVIESDKASMEVPAGLSGIVESITVKVGDQVGQGQLIARITEADGGDTTQGARAVAEKQPPEASVAKEQPAKQGSEQKSEEQAQPETETVRSTESAPKAEPVSADTEVSAAGESTLEVRVPEIGDATGVEVIEVAVKPGAKVGADDLLVVVESDKASMEIPAGAAGTVAQVHVAVGDEVEEGTLLATLRVSGSVEKSAGTVSESRTPGPAPVAERGSPVTAAPPETPVVEESGEQKSAELTEAAGAGAEARVYAGPAVRRLARELGVRLADVRGSGSRGRILKDDVKEFVKKKLTTGASAPGVVAGSGIPPVPKVDFSKFGPVRTEALSRIRAAGAANLHRSWLNLPHVTQFDEVDVTDLESFRRSLKVESERRGIKLTPLSFIIKACCHALRAHPYFNASLDLQAGQFILKEYFHIGIAVDTVDGLVVPVIRDADQKGLWELSEAIIELSQKARDKKLGLNDMQGGTFSVSSLGAIGGSGFTPIINAPEVAILGVSKLSTKPVWDGNAFEPRGMLPLSLSYDHRAINGAEAGRFMATLTELLADIRRLAL